jgi:hypothetical protein
MRFIVDIILVVYVFWVGVLLGAAFWPRDPEVRYFPMASVRKATLEDVRRDWGIEGRLDCRVVQR